MLPNPRRRWPLACGPEPERLGLRVPALSDALAPLAAMRWPVLQSSANLSGRRDARRLEDVHPRIRRGVDLAARRRRAARHASTVLDLTSYEGDGAFVVVREGAVPAPAWPRTLRTARGGEAAGTVSR